VGRAVNAARIAGYAGVAVHLILAVLPFSASGLVAPLWAVILLWVVWGALLVVAWRLLQRRPLMVLAVPVVALLIWFAVLTIGQQLLGWTP
jgi:hypothetical protein